MTFEEAVEWIEEFYKSYPSGLTDWKGPYGTVGSDLGYVEDFWNHGFKDQLLRAHKEAHS